MYLPGWTTPRPPPQHFFRTVLTSVLHTITLMSTNTPCHFNANTLDTEVLLCIHLAGCLAGEPCERELRGRKHLQAPGSCCRCWCGFASGDCFHLCTCMSLGDDSPLCSWIFGECEGRHVSGIEVVPGNRLFLPLSACGTWDLSRGWLDSASFNHLNATVGGAASWMPSKMKVIKLFWLVQVHNCQFLSYFKLAYVVLWDQIGRPRT